jgi:hypothetical protein
MNNVNFLVGSSSYCLKPFEPFSNQVISFLNVFSKELNTEKLVRNYPDLRALSFWCRKKNILKMRQKFLSSSNRIGLGLVFHITPSNIPTQFAYSLIFGLLSGNSNIVKVPSKNFDQIKIICNILCKIFKKKKSFIEKKVTIIRYNNDDIITKKFSMACDARLIWGGDKTINDLKSFKTHEKNLDIVFADRYSFCVIDQFKVSKLKDLELKNLAQKFYNDTFLVDQNACSSPHLIIWTGKKNIKSRERFWKSVYSLVKLKYNLSDSAPSEKYNDLCKYILSLKNIMSVQTFENFIYKIKIKKLTKDNDSIRGKWGLFFEYETKNINKVKEFVNNKYQTLTYFGIDKNKLKDFVFKNNLKGIDRIVPIGQSLNIGLMWDGYNIPTILSRGVEIQ